MPTHPPSDGTQLPRSDDDSTRYRPADTSRADDSRRSGAAATGGDDSSRFTFPMEDETDMVSPEERAKWEGKGGESPQPINLRPVLSEKGRKGPVSGAQWPGYDIGDLLGEGGMAAVYLARRRDNGRLVALKILPARFADDAASRKRFEREAQISQAIDSRHVVKVWSAGRFGPLCYLEMEFVDGTSLGDELKRRRETGEKPFTSEEVIDLALQIADGLLEAAKHQLVHRDIKPGNLMRTREGVLKIADFGIVKVLGEEALTMAGTAMGTPSYMSPEQGRGDTVDARADLYSFGVVLYELLTLKQPFEEATADALIYQHHFVEPKLITDLVPNCDPGLQAVVFKCLQKYPARRYGDANDVIRDLNLLKGGCPPEHAVFAKGRVTTGADEALARHGGGWRRWWKQGLAGVAMLVLAVGIGVWWLLASRAQAEALRGRLTLLDTPQAIPLAAGLDLTRLRELVGERDPQVGRWTIKLAQAQELRTQLQAVPVGALTFSDLTTASTALAAYQELCGSSEPVVTGWRARLDEAAREVREARGALAVLDRQDSVPKDQLDRLVPVLATARRLLPATDADVIRWTERLTTAQQRLSDLRIRLATIDSSTVLPVAAQRTAREDLTRWTALMGSADEDALRWTAKLNAAQEQVATLRQALLQLDAGAIASLAVAESLAADWATFTALVDADDADLLRWSTRLAAAHERRDALVKNLAALDGDQPIVWSHYTTLVNDMVTYRTIAGNDAAARRWQSRLVTITATRNTLQQVLTSLLDKEELSQEEQQLLRTTAERLKSEEALDKAAIQRVDERLARDAARLVLLSERLAVLDRQEDINDNLRPLLEQFERLAAVDDARRPQWRHKLDMVVELRRRLAALDERQPVAPEADRDLAQLVTLVGVAPSDVRRWGDALTAIHAHKTALASLDVSGPVEVGAPERLDRLRKLVGDTDADVQRWQSKLERVSRLRTSLTGLDEAYLLPTAASDDLRALRALVGDGDALVQSAAARLHVLEGPGRPHWASAFGRDEFGLYAELTVWQQTQRFRYIPAGTFTLGSPTAEAGRESDEAAVAVRLSRSLWLAESECAQGLWAQIMLENPAYHAQAGHPVERVSWNDAQRFLTLLTKRVQGGVPARLPTEAEWEYAARAGATGSLPGHDAAGGDDLDRMAVHAGNAGGASRAVRGRQPNRLGLYDLLGNVWEWCQDTYAPYPLVPSTDPLANQGSKRVVRGGSWGDASSLLRVADRHALAADVRSAYVGLRIAIDVEWPQP